MILFLTLFVGWKFFYIYQMRKSFFFHIVLFCIYGTEDRHCKSLTLLLEIWINDSFIKIFVMGLSFKSDFICLINFCELCQLLINHKSALSKQEFCLVLFLYIWNKKFILKLIYLQIVVIINLCIAYLDFYD